MKFIIAILIVAIVIACFFMLKPNNETLLQKKWQTLINSKTAIEESNNVINLNHWLSKKDASIKLIAINNNGNESNIALKEFDKKSFKEIKIIVHWNNGKQLTAQRWKPKDINNAYKFFYE